MSESPSNGVLHDNVVERGMEDEEDIDEMEDTNPDEEVDGVKTEILEEEAKDEEAMMDRKTTKYMTKYERARILGTRALQISLGAPVMCDLRDETDPLQIALMELKLEKIPIIIRRYLPDGSYEDWSANELILDF